MKSIQSYVFKDAQEASGACSLKTQALRKQGLVSSPVATLAVSADSAPKLSLDDEDVEGVVHDGKFHQWRITLLPGALGSARHKILLVAGEDRAEPSRAVFEGQYKPKKSPAQLATHDGRNAMWFSDREAARLLE